MSPAPESLAKYRTIERVRPGMWWLEDYEAGMFWSECTSQLTLTKRATGAKVVQLRGVATDGRGAEISQNRDYEVLTLTAAQARKCGLGTAP